MSVDSFILLWCSGKSLPFILYLILRWGYVYVNVVIAWVKTYNNGEPRLGLGYWTRNNLEMVVMAKRGKTA